MIIFPAKELRILVGNKYLAYLPENRLIILDCTAAVFFREPLTKNELQHHIYLTQAHFQNYF